MYPSSPASGGDHVQQRTAACKGILESSVAIGRVNHLQHSPAFQFHLHPNEVRLWLARWLRRRLARALKRQPNEPDQRARRLVWPEASFSTAASNRVSVRLRPVLPRTFTDVAAISITSCLSSAEIGPPARGDWLRRCVAARCAALRLPAGWALTTCAPPSGGVPPPPCARARPRTPNF